MALNLSRKEGEKIMVGDDIVLTIVEIRGNTVRVAVDAPRDVEVHREKVYQQVAAEKRAAEKAGLSAADANPVDRATNGRESDAQGAQERNS